MYTLAQHGDNLEQQAWDLFVRAEFPAYEVFWQRNIVPLSNRPSNVQLKDDVALAAIAKTMRTWPSLNFTTRF